VFLALYLSLLCNSAGPASSSTIADTVKIAADNIPVERWSDSSLRTKAIVVTVHGAARHASTFQPLAEQLAAKGFLVISPDLRGHGQWYFGAKTAAERVVDYDRSTDDLVQIVEGMRSQHPLLPIFCVGESAGAAVVIKAATRCPALNGVVLSSIGTKPCFHDLSTVVKDVCIGLQHFDEPLDVKQSIIKYSSDEERVRVAAAEDPLLKPGLSARELVRTGWLLSHTSEFASRLPATLPVLMLQGKKDEIVEPSSAKKLLQRVSSHDKSLTEFPYGHILLSTPFLRDDVVSVLTNWLSERCAEQQTALLSGGTTTSER
jgi:alpha-beta hydrolase superfamily lysophospholipase